LIKYKTIASFIAFCSLILVLAETTIVADKSQQLKSLEWKQGHLIKEFEFKRSQAEQYDAYKQQLVELETSLAELVRTLPDHIAQSEVHKDFSDVAIKSGTEINRFSLEKENTREFYAESLFKIQMDSDFEPIYSFISNLSSHPRLSVIRSLRIRPYGSKLRANLEIMVYRYVLEDEQ